MRIRLTVPGEPNEETLGIALEAATRLAQHDVAAGRVPPIEEAIAQGIEWQPEPPGDESFDPPHVVMARGNGDCDDLAPWLAAEMRETGFDGGASAIALPSGRNQWHAIVRGSDGELFDPSRWAGMPHTVVGQCMPCSRPLNAGRPAISMGRSVVRVDMPGLQARRGCLIGTSHECDCEATDEDRVRALIQTIEDAIATAQLARTGDARSIKALAVLYRVLRGDDPSAACNGLGIRPEQVGIDFSSGEIRRFIQRAREVLASAADELFNGETWTAHNGRIVKARKVAIGQRHQVGFAPCLAVALTGPLMAAATAGTIAAVLDPLAAILREMAGTDTDFGRAMATIREVVGPIKMASSFAAGLGALLESGIPASIQATTSRWVELMQAPGTKQQLKDPTRALDAAKVLSWTERALNTRLPTGLATQLTPMVLDFVARGEYKDAVISMRDRLKKFVKDETGFPDLSDQLAEEMAINALKALSEHPEDPPDLPALVTDAVAPLGPEARKEWARTELRAPTDDVPAETEEAEDVREQLRTVPIIATVPAGWDPIFAMGCRQLTDQCPQ